MTLCWRNIGFFSAVLIQSDMKDVVDGMSPEGMKALTLRNWIYLFWTTLVAGALASLAAGLILQGMDREFMFLGSSGIGFNLFAMLMGGLMFSIISQMGLFAYLTLNYIAIGIFRKKYWWNFVQLLLTVIGLFELFYLRRLGFPDTYSGWHYAVLPAALLVAGWAVAYWKVKLTHAGAWIPTLFFIIVATAVEAIPALRLNNPSSSFFMVFPLFVCNAWQILRLHRLVGSKRAA